MTILFLFAACLIAAVDAAAEERLIRKELPIRDQCLICKTAANIAGWAAQNKLGKEYVRQQMKFFCTFSMHPPSCDIQSEQILPLLLEAISTAAENQGICESITATDCAQVFKGQRSEGMDCTLCRLWTKLVAKKIMNRSHELKLYFELLCNSSKLNAAAKGQCIDIFEKRFDEAFQALVRMFVNTALCDYGHFCLTEGNNTTRNVPHDDENYGCSLCQSFAAYVGLAVDKGQFEKYYMQLLHMFCSFFPNDLQKQCASFMDDYAKQFMEDAMWVLSPEVLCPAVGLC